MSTCRSPPRRAAAVWPVGETFAGPFPASDRSLGSCNAARSPPGWIWNAGSTTTLRSSPSCYPASHSLSLSVFFYPPSSPLFFLLFFTFFSPRCFSFAAVSAQPTKRTKRTERSSARAGNTATRVLGSLPPRRLSHTYSAKAYDDRKSPIRNYISRASVTGRNMRYHHQRHCCHYHRVNFIRARRCSFFNRSQSNCNCVFARTVTHTRINGVRYRYTCGRMWHIDMVEGKRYFVQRSLPSFVHDTYDRPWWPAPNRARSNNHRAVHIVSLHVLCYDHPRMLTCLAALLFNSLSFSLPFLILAPKKRVNRSCTRCDTPSLPVAR